MGFAHACGFDHAVGHDCESCRAIRATGPQLRGSPLVRLMGEQAALTGIPDALLPKKEQRKRARRRFARAMRGEFTRSRSTA